MGTLVVVLLVIIAVLFAWIIKLLGDKPPAVSSRSYDVPDYNMHENSAEEVSAEIEAAGERMLRRIDHKIEQLKQVMGEADRRMEKMNSAREHVQPVESPNRDADEHNARRERLNRLMEDGRKAKIISLKRRGVPPAKIAREVGMGLGEVELILKIEGY